MVAKIIIGDRGQVAKALRENFSASGQDYVNTARRVEEGHEEKYLDLLDRNSIQKIFENFAKKNNNQTTDVYLTAALTNVEHCETHPDQCHAVNVQGVRWIAEECKRYQHKLLFYSSEYVFGDAEYQHGVCGPFLESDPIAPPCTYGRAKAEAEKIVLSLCENALVVRTTTVFSFDPESLNFAMQIYRLLNEAKADPGFSRTMNIPEDQISTPTYAAALAEASIALMQKKQQGIFHVVGSDLLSRSAFTKKLIEFYQFPVDKSLKHFHFLPTVTLKQKAKRPLRSGLKTDKAKNLDIKIWSLAESFAHMKKVMESTNAK